MKFIFSVFLLLACTGEPCKDTDTQCNGNSIEVCLSDGEWISDINCAKDIMTDDKLFCCQTKAWGATCETIVECEMLKEME